MLNLAFVLGLVLIGFSGGGVWLVAAPAHARQLLSEAFLGVTPQRSSLQLIVTRLAGMAMIGFACYLAANVLHLGQALLNAV